MSIGTTYTLAEAMDLYFSFNDISKKKYFSSYLITARFVWKDIFKNTLFQTQSVWKTMQRGDPYNYVEIPTNTERIFSVSVEDDCGNVVPLFYNNRINVVKKPTKKKCGCTQCDCSGLCEDANSLTLTTKLIYTINGQEYFETTWLESCSNGDMLEWKKTPVKKYNTVLGDGGDFNADYNDDYLIGAAPFAAYTIEYITTQRKICHLETLPCGCPIESAENINTFNESCGCFLDCCRRKRHCDHFLADPNSNGRGEVKISECGTRIEYRPPPRHCCHPNHKKIPEFLLINLQTNAEDCGQDVLVPEYALECLHDGVDAVKKKRKDKYSPNEKLAAGWQYEASRNKVLLYLNPISLANLADIQDAPIRW